MFSHVLHAYKASLCNWIQFSLIIPDMLLLYRNFKNVNMQKPGYLKQMVVDGVS